MSKRPTSGGDFLAPTEEVIERIITDDNATDLLVNVADGLGEALARPLSTSQIRSIYGEVLRIKADWLGSREEEAGKKARAKRALVLLRPKMAYRAKKEGGQAVKQLVDVLDRAVKRVGGDDGNFRRFVDFFEAILAYHKAHGGK